MKLRHLTIGDKFRYVEGEDCGVTHTVTEQNDVRAFVCAEIGLTFNPVQCVSGETEVEKILQEQVKAK